ncbi:small ribosomal subunit protein bS18m isoform X5 [Odocoileus virginianus]|uniref:Small ribosomal subunit protein bS18m isoform X5 n=1 Tax=Odocoileus virginianus TaxID=9874 RepID=A0ABM4HFG7_ODOVR
MAALVAVCSALGKRKFTRFPAAFVCLTNPGTRAVLCRSCSQYKQVTSNEDLPIPMENPYKEPLKKCILCEKRVDYKNVQVFVGRNKKKSQKQLRELKYWDDSLLSFSNWGQGNIPVYKKEQDNSVHLLCKH